MAPQEEILAGIVVIIPDEDLAGLRTVGDVVSYIKRLACRPLRIRRARLIPRDWGVITFCLGWDSGDEGRVTYVSSRFR
jgi:hypothetical protein